MTAARGRGPGWWRPSAQVDGHAAKGGQPAIELSLDDPAVQQLVVFTHALHGAKAP